MATYQSQRVYIIVGQVYTGKATTANCIINNSGEMNELEHPFSNFMKRHFKSNGSNAFKDLEMFQKNDMIIFNVAGFDDKNAKYTEGLKLLKTNLEEKYRGMVNGIIIVYRKELVSTKSLKFIEAVTKNQFFKTLFNVDLKPKMLLLLTNSDNNWKNIEKNVDFQKLKEFCNNKSLDFNLRMDDENDTTEDREANKKQRQGRINALMKIINEEWATPTSILSQEP